MDAYRVVAEAFEPGDKRIRKRMIREIGRTDKIDPVKPLSISRKLLELKPSASILQPAVLPGRGIGKTHSGEVQRTARLYIAAIVERNPLFPRRNDMRFPIGGHKRNVRGHDERERQNFALRETASPELSNPHRIDVFPPAAILNEMFYRICGDKAYRDAFLRKREPELSEASAC